MKKAVIVVLAVAVISAIPVIWYLVPKSEPHPMNEEYFTAHYRGFGLTNDNSIFGKRWYAVTFILPDDGGRYRYEFNREGYNPFKGFYPDGTLREEGECYVEVMGFHDQPFPAHENLKWTKCYRPDGSLGSRVEGGTGTQTIWTPDGTKTWELELKNFKRVKLTQWHRNGQLRKVLNYVEGKRDGPFISYDAKGGKKTEGAYKAGERAGTWKRYNPDGSVGSIEKYEDHPEKPQPPTSG